jgi:hypothetical protein
MRPYTDDGKTPKKRQHTKRGTKAANGVKKTLVKAKVNAVKKIKARGKNVDDVEDLLEQTANGQPSTPIGKAVINKAAKTSTASKQMKKLKSLVSVNNGAERRSERQKQKRDEVQGSSNGNVEVAMEATETNGIRNGTSNGGLLQRTISKIWRIPEGLTGVPYNDINAASPVKKTESPAKAASEAANTSNNAKNACVIS